MVYKSNNTLVIWRDRDCSLDTLKFILIFLVALCHSLEPFRYNHYVVGAFYSLVYAFHMPLFVMLSGYFSKQVTFTKLKQGIPKLLETYFVMCIIVMLFLHNINELKAPLLSEWYLLSLVFWRICASVVSYFKLKKIFVITLSFVGAFAAFILLGHHSYTLSSMRTMLFLPYFFIGYFLSQDNIRFFRRHWKIFLSIALPFVIMLAVSSVSLAREIHVMEFNSDGILTISYLFNERYLNVILCKSFFYCVGIVFCFSALSLNLKNKRIAKFGNYTLFFYCIQLYLIQIPEKQNVFSNIWISVFSTIFVMFVSCLLTHYRNVLFFITNPISTIVDKILNK